MISDFKDLVQTMKNAKTASMKRQCSSLKLKPNSPFSSLRALNVYLSGPSGSDSDEAHTPTRLSFLPGETDAGSSLLSVSTRFNSLNRNLEVPRVPSEGGKVDDCEGKGVTNTPEESSNDDLESLIAMTPFSRRRKPMPSRD